jgi:polysaccharide deacetylase family protein (PEP-CTERM system associated)
VKVSKESDAMTGAERRHALSVDLEEYFHVSNFAGLIDPARWPALPSRIEAQTRRLLDLFDEAGCHATFFALGWVAERHPRLVAEIARRGHEVACHGYGHALVSELGPKAFRTDLRRARAAIEDAAGAPVRGYRAPSYSITTRSLWALGILAEEGFAYDSSIFPIHHPTYGIPDFESQLTTLDLGDGLSLVEFPLTTAQVGRWKLPVAGGAYLRLLPAPVFRWGFRRAIRSGQPAVLYLHPWEIDPHQPRMRVDWKVRIRHYRNLDRVEGRLRQLLAQTPFDTMARTIETWREAGLVPTRPLEQCIRRPASGLQPRPRPAEREDRG